MIQAAAASLFLAALTPARDPIPLAPQRRVKLTREEVISEIRRMFFRDLRLDITIAERQALGVAVEEAYVSYLQRRRPVTRKTPYRGVEIEITVKKAGGALFLTVEHPGGPVHAAFMIKTEEFRPAGRA